MIKPMLAGKADLEKITYPVYASPKLDGVRGMVHQNTLRSRSWKTFPNQFAQDRFSTRILSGLDGELILGSPTADDVYRVTNGALQRHDGQPDVKFYVFDIWDSKLPYEQRLEDLHLITGELVDVIAVEQTLIKDAEELNLYELNALGDGYEGVMIRDPQGYYKFGRSSVRSAELLKVKTFLDSEAIILDVYEEMHNANEATRNAFGRTERSSHKANLVGKERLGGLVVRDVSTGVEFSVGTGFTEEDRIKLWKSRGTLVGQHVKYKYFPVGVKDKPRHPVFLGFRMKEDMS